MSLIKLYSKIKEGGESIKSSCVKTPFSHILSSVDLPIVGI